MNTIPNESRSNDNNLFGSEPGMFGPYSIPAAFTPGTSCRWEKCGRHLPYTRGSPRWPESGMQVSSEYVYRYLHTCDVWVLHGMAERSGHWLSSISYIAIVLAFNSFYFLAHPCVKHQTNRVRNKGLPGGWLSLRKRGHQLPPPSGWQGLDHVQDGRRPQGQQKSRTSSLGRDLLRRTVCRL